METIDYKDFPELYDEGNDLWLITLDRFYINKEFRHKGISKFIHKYMFDILKTYFGITSAFLCGVLIPDEEKGVDEKKMMESQKKAYKTQKYCKVGKVDGEVFFCQLVYKPRKNR